MRQVDSMNDDFVTDKHARWQDTSVSAQGQAFTC